MNLESNGLVDYSDPYPADSEQFFLIEELYKSTDLQQNTEFRIKYPRGDLGQSSGESELFMLVEHMSGLLEDLEKEVKEMRHNAVNIEFLKEQVKKLNEDVEKLIRNGGSQ